MSRLLIVFCALCFVTELMMPVKAEGSQWSIADDKRCERYWEPKYPMEWFYKSGGSSAAYFEYVLHGELFYTKRHRSSDGVATKILQAVHLRIDCKKFDTLPRNVETEEHLRNLDEKCDRL